MSEFSYEIFKACVEEIVNVSQMIKDGWKLIENGNDQIYIMKKQVFVGNISLEECKTEMEENVAESSEDDYDDDHDDDHEKVEEKNLFNAEYHVVYNMSYNVPMLCFNVWNSRGELLPLAEVWKMIPPLYKGDEKDFFSTVTQMDHPVLQRPFFTLHPCKTEELLLNESCNPVLSWLCAVGPAVQLNMPIKYMEFLKNWTEIAASH